MTPPNDRRRDDDAEARARQGQSLAHGDTGKGDDPGVDPERQGLSNRPGDRADAEPSDRAGDTPLAGDLDRERLDADGVEPDGASGDRTTTTR